MQFTHKLVPSAELTVQEADHSRALKDLTHHKLAPGAELTVWSRAFWAHGPFGRAGLLVARPLGHNPAKGLQVVNNEAEKRRPPKTPSSKKKRRAKNAEFQKTPGEKNRKQNFKRSGILRTKAPN